MIKATARLIQTYDWKSPPDSSLQEDQYGYEDGPKWSSCTKIATISEILVLTSGYKMAIKSIEMASDGKCFNMKVVRLVETVDSHITVVPT